jgi:hypothetical protein
MSEGWWIGRGTAAVDKSPAKKPGVSKARPDEDDERTGGVKDPGYKPLPHPTKN